MKLIVLLTLIIIHDIITLDNLVRVPTPCYYSFYKHKINYKNYLMCENIGN